MEHNKIKKDKTVNISVDNLIKSVMCDKPSSEGYDVQNLISNQLFEKSKGFLSERFISPPVVLTFEFKVSVYIQYIVVYCKVGAQKTTGIEILCQPTNGEFVSIGSGVLNDSKSGFVFHRYNETVNGMFDENYLIRTFKPKSCSLLSNAKELQIKIFRTSGTSVPALGKVEFWGIPRRFERNEEQVCYLEESNYMDLDEDKKPATDFQTVCVLNKYRSISKNACKQQHMSIPEDFVDPITFEVMTLPVILPSGKIIDHATLASYEKAERLWGRSPNDPFTGVIFTESSKPVAATDLKARIDQYLSKNSNCTELLNIPRPLGRSYSNVNSQCKAGISKLISNSTTKSNTIVNLSVGSNQGYEIKVKRRKLESTIPIEKEDESNLLRTATELHNKPKTLCEPSKNNRTSSFQERMEKSLELTLKSTLAKLPNFTASKPKLEEITVDCNTCKSTNNLFTIPCNHYVCRNCLIGSSNKSEMKCSLCNDMFRSSDINKIHLN